MRGVAVGDHQRLVLAQSEVAEEPFGDLAHLLGRHKPPWSGKRARLHATKPRSASCLVVEDVGIHIKDDLLTRLALGQHRDQIP